MLRIGRAFRSGRTAAQLVRTTCERRRLETAQLGLAASRETPLAPPADPPGKVAPKWFRRYAEGVSPGPTLWLPNSGFLLTPHVPGDPKLRVLLQDLARPKQVFERREMGVAGVLRPHVGDEKLPATR